MWDLFKESLSRAWTKTLAFGREHLLVAAAVLLAGLLLGWFFIAGSVFEGIATGAIVSIAGSVIVLFSMFLWYAATEPYRCWRDANHVIAEKDAVIQQLADRLDPADLEIDLKPTSGSGPQMLEVTNRGRTRELRATCRILQLRNDPNPPDQPGTYPLSWTDHGKVSITIVPNEPARLLVATSHNLKGGGDYLSGLGEMRLWSYAANDPSGQKVVHSCRWNMPQEDLPEYDLEVSLQSSSGQTAMRRFTVRPKSWHGRLQMFPAIVPSLAERAAAEEVLMLGTAIVDLLKGPCEDVQQVQEAIGSLDRYLEGIENTAARVHVLGREILKHCLTAIQGATSIIRVPLRADLDVRQVANVTERVRLIADYPVVDDAT